MEKEKLTLKELAGYLPYGLQGVEYKDGSKFTLTEIRYYAEPNFYWENNNEIDKKSRWCKPILRPLSDLTKPIIHNGETFVPWVKLEIDSSIVDFITANNQLIIRPIDCEFIYAIDVYNNVIQKLYEWHFDIHGLIERGLAININDFSNARFSTCVD